MSEMTFTILTQTAPSTVSQHGSFLDLLVAALGPSRRRSKSWTRPSMRFIAARHARAAGRMARGSMRRAL